MSALRNEIAKRLTVVPDRKLGELQAGLPVKFPLETGKIEIGVRSPSLN